MLLADIFSNTFDLQCSIINIHYLYNSVAIVVAARFHTVWTHICILRPLEVKTSDCTERPCQHSPV